MRKLIAALVVSFAAVGAFAEQSSSPRLIRVQHATLGEGPSTLVPGPGSLPPARIRVELQVGLSTVDWDGVGLVKTVPIRPDLAVSAVPPAPLRPWPTLPPRPPPPSQRIPPGMNRPALEFDPPPADIMQAEVLVSELQSSVALLPEEKRDILAEWDDLSRRHEAIVQGQEAVVARWAALDLESKFDRYVETYWSLTDRYSSLEARFASYRTYCSRQVPREEYDEAVRECNQIKSKLDSDLTDLNAENATSAAFFEEEIRKPSMEVAATVTSQNSNFFSWLDQLKGFNSRVEARIRPRRENSHISIHIQADGQTGSHSWIAGGTRPKPTRATATALLESVGINGKAVLGNRPQNLAGLDAALAKYRYLLATHSQFKGVTPWTFPFGEQAQFRLDMEIYGEYPFKGVP